MPLAPLAAFGQAAGEFVDDHDLAVANDVLPVEKVLAVDLDRPLDVLVDVDHAHAGPSPRAWAACATCRRPSAVSSTVLLLVIVFVVLVFDELVGHRGGPLVGLHRDHLRPRSATRR